MKSFFKEHSIALSIIIFFTFFLSPNSLYPTQNIFIAQADDTLTVSGTVLGPPMQPIVVGEAVCSAHNLFVTLDWPTDLNSETFDVRRNGELLATGLINSDYEDSDVQTNASNTYQVIARGPMGPGSATSEEITFLTPPECPIPQPPYLQEIKTLENAPLASYGEKPAIEERRPSFSGKTNIFNAKIEIVLDGSPKIYQTIFANTNGFWTWQSPEILDRGVHTLFVTATDLYFPLITASDDFQFSVVKIDTDDTINGKGKDGSPAKKRPGAVPISYIPDEVELLEKTSENAPFQITVVVENFNHRVFAGEKLSLHIDFSKKASFLEDKKYQIFYEIIDSNGEIIYVDSELINILRDDGINKKVSISALAPIGDYRIRIKAYDGKTLIAGENFFSVHELPLINIGFCQISLTELLNNFAWLFIVILLIFLFLLRAEKHRSEEGIYQMTEKYLKKGGFFSRKND